MSRRTLEGWESGHRDVPFPIMLEMALQQLEKTMSKRPLPRIAWTRPCGHPGTAILGRDDIQNAANVMAAGCGDCYRAGRPVSVLPVPESPITDPVRAAWAHRTYTTHYDDSLEGDEGAAQSDERYAYEALRESHDYDEM